MFVELTPLQCSFAAHWESSVHRLRQVVAPFESFVQMASSTHSSVSPDVSHASPVSARPQARQSAKVGISHRFIRVIIAAHTVRRQVAKPGIAR